MLSVCLQALKLGPNDIVLASTGGSVQLAVQKTFTLRLGTPFVGESVLTFALVSSMHGTIVNPNMLSKMWLSQAIVLHLRSRPVDGPGWLSTMYRKQHSLRPCIRFNANWQTHSTTLMSILHTLVYA